MPEQKNIAEINLPVINEILSLNDLRKMRGEPVYFKPLGWRICYGIEPAKLHNGVEKVNLGNGCYLDAADYRIAWTPYTKDPDQAVYDEKGNCRQIHDLYRTYPINLVMEILRGSFGFRGVRHLPVGYEHFVEYALDRESKDKPQAVYMTRLYYREHMTLAAIANAMDIPYKEVQYAIREVVWEIHRSKLLCGFIVDGPEETLEKRKRKEIARERKIAHQEGYKEGYDKGYYEGRCYQANNVQIPPSPYDHLFIDELNLSVRAWNVLRRSGKEFIRDVAACTYDDFKKMRNCGEKTRCEIVDKMKELGYDTAAMEPPNKE